MQVAQCAVFMAQILLRLGTELWSRVRLVHSTQL